VSTDVAQILSVARDSDKVCIEFDIQPDLVWFDGHFPECPILPGVVQTHWAITYGCEHYGIGGQFTRLGNVKFMKVIVPGMRVTLELKFESAKRLLNFRYLHDGAVCSQGTAEFAAV
jgi:3-hydroxymyristoyl/3-hydroxydecanoyl-(acyl carrier protein) dehydratase